MILRETILHVHTTISIDVLKELGMTGYACRDGPGGVTHGVQEMDTGVKLQYIHSCGLD